MEYYQKEILKAHYRQIHAKNRDILLAGGHGDPYLAAPGADTRMALALLIRISPEVTEQILSWQREVRRVEPDLYYYPGEDLHITVLDILRGVAGRTVPERIGDYIRCVQDCAAKIRPFSVEFAGTTVSDSAALVCGYYEYGLEQLRRSLRRALADAGLALEERYETRSAHITAIRVPDRLSDPKAFLKCAQSSREFGRMRVDSVELAFHNWYDSKKTWIAEGKLYDL